MNPKDMAMDCFGRIGEGHRNAVRRPYHSPSADRMFRRLVEEANLNGDCIIPREHGEGYYRPLPYDEVDRMEFNKYIKNEISRANSLDLKVESMKFAFACRLSEIGD